MLRTSFAFLAALLGLAAASPAAERAASATENLPPDAVLSGSATPPASDMAWWYRAPATKFWEGVPLATGRFGAMIYGRVRD